MKQTIGIIGGGASGMMAGIVASMLGAKVTIFEHNDRIGKKILVTGNGKCNFTNEYIDASCYYGTHPEFAMKILEAFTVSDTLNLFSFLGLLYKQKNGYYYPVSNQAATILDLLRFQLQNNKVNIKTEIHVQAVKQKNKGYEIITDNSKEYFDTVFICAGSKAASKTGSDGSGYTLLEKLHLPVITPFPALVQLTSKENYFKQIAGIRFDGSISLYHGQELLSNQQGEIQITDYGVSGIPVFQLSRLVSKHFLNKNAPLLKMKLDTLPQYNMNEIFNILLQKKKQQGVLEIQDALQGIHNKKLNLLFLKILQLSPSMYLSKIDDASLKKLAHLYKEWTITIQGTKDFSSCQVCGGGLDTTALDAHMQLKKYPNLYVLGELVDIDGICGGYNLQWAWSSAVVAALNACGQNKDGLCYESIK